MSDTRICPNYIMTDQYFSRFLAAAVTITDGTFVWNSELGPILKNINLELTECSLVAVVGQVGSGKTSLISAVLGEMEKIKGYVSVKGSTAYVSQQTWIQNASLQNNILFGSEMDRERYDRTLDACALNPDLEVLPAADLTEIGEKGINLSGGQKQRVSLARAVYFDADIYLLDDPLSSVDSHVGKHIFQKVISNDGLLKNKTRLLVTHGVHWLPLVDKIVVMKKGQISEMGSYEELMGHEGPFAKFLMTYLKQTEDVEEEDPEVLEVKVQMRKKLNSVCSNVETSDSDDYSNEENEHMNEGERVISHQYSENSSSSDDSSTLLSENEGEDDKLIEEEEVKTGRVKMSVFKAYAKSMGYGSTALIFLSYALFEVCSAASNIWLSQWTADPILTNRSLPANSSIYQDKNSFYLGIYGSLGFGQFIFIMFYAFFNAFVMVKASRHLHSSMLMTVLRSPMSFFHTTPVGRIINRFSGDIEVIDEELPTSFDNWLDEFFFLISTLIVISYSTPIFLSVIIPLIIVYLLIQRFYIATSRQLKRLDSKSLSPIYSHFSETLTGVATIRAFGVQDRFIVESEKRVDTNQQFSFVTNTSNRWLGIRLELLGNFVILSAALFAVIERSDISGALVGLSISYALEVTSGLNWFVQMTSDLETHIVSVERVKEYIDQSTESELEAEKHLDNNWPKHGAVAFQNYSTRYRPGLEPVLSDINVWIDPGEKIGIVGRTGAGKSSLTLALFRLLESTEGAIVIDGINICQIGLHSLRSRITVLPQEPVVFSGSIRMNLDPLMCHLDEEIWTSLEHVHLKNFVQSLPGQLEYECGEGGQVFSVGQRQLVCLARSLLRKTKVLILDEATAAVDMETDDLIQKTIRTEFKECTVLTIAHRLNTIMDYDRILVLDRALVVEFDTPDALLQRKEGFFYKLAKDAGIAETGS